VQAKSSLPGDLERRVAALERIETTDFDRQGWWWMIVLGILLPIALVVFGWWMGANANVGATP